MNKLKKPKHCLTPGFLKSLSDIFGFASAAASSSSSTNLSIDKRRLAGKEAWKGVCNGRHRRMILRNLSTKGWTRSMVYNGHLIETQDFF